MTEMGADEPFILMIGDSLERLKALPDASIDSCVTDPPYGLSEHRPEDVAACLTAWLAGQEYRPNKRGFMGKCVHPDTEVLTPVGWKNIAHVAVGDNVYSLAPRGSIEVAEVVATYEYPYVGELVRIESRSVASVVTPNHNAWVGSKKNGSLTYNACRADELPRSFLQANQGAWDGEEVETIRVEGQEYNATALLSTLGLFLGDGYTVNRVAQPGKQDFWGFSVRKSRKAEAIRKALLSLGVRFTENGGPDRVVTSFYVYDTVLLRYLQPLGKANDKFIPSDLFRLSSRLLEFMYQGMIETDGTRQGAKGQEVYATISSRLADDFQHLCFLTGRSCIRIERSAESHRGFPNGKTSFVLPVLQAGKQGCWLERDGRSNRPQPANVTREQHSGAVRCIELEKNHVMLTRIGGKPVWTGNSWDAWVPGPELWREVYRVLKPGGHLLAMAGSRTQDLMGMAIRLAGFELRDSVSWVHSQGFPKSLDVGKAIDAIGGIHPNWQPELYEQAVRASSFTHADIDRHLGLKASSCYWARTDHRRCVPAYAHWALARDMLGLDDSFAAVTPEAERAALGQRSVPIGHAFAGPTYGGDSASATVNVTAPATEAAKQWDGWGTALKPAHEPIIVARKSLEGTVAANVVKYGTGGLNIDGCRVGFAGAEDERESKQKNAHATFGSGEVVGYHGWDSRAAGGNYNPPGRWPPNVLLSHARGCVQVGTVTVPGDARAGQEDKLGGTRPGGFGDVGAASGADKPNGAVYGSTEAPLWACVPGCPIRALDDQAGHRKPTSAVSRFFPILPIDDPTEAPFFYSSKTSTAERNAGLPEGEVNKHPTVKPIALCRWLLRLVTPPGGVVLDPFCGSGSFGCAAMLEDFGFLGIDLGAEHIRIARFRLLSAWRGGRSGS